MKSIYFLTYKKVFSQHLKPWSTLDLETLIRQLSTYGQIAEAIEYEDALQLGDYKDTLFITSSSQNIVRKRYIEDVCYELMSRGGELVPSFELLKAHENKGFQALISARLGIKKPAEKYYVLDSNHNKKSSEQPKYVLKTIDGASSQGVALILNSSDLTKFYYKNIFNSLSLKKILKSFKQKAKQYFPLKNYSAEQDSFYSASLACCEQEFIDGLTFDYKVIVFYDKYFFLKRLMNEGDFRASGSNNFETLNEVDLDLLNFSKNVFDKFDAPYLSIDVAERNGEFFVIEFQGPHFGPYTVLSAECFYQCNNDTWSRKLNELDSLEDIYAYSLSRFLELK